MAPSSCHGTLYTIPQADTACCVRPLDTGTITSSNSSSSSSTKMCDGEHARIEPFTQRPGAAHPFAKQAAREIVLKLGFPDPQDLNCCVFVLCKNSMIERCVTSSKCKCQRLRRVQLQRISSMQKHGNQRTVPGVCHSEMTIRGPPRYGVFYRRMGQARRGSHRCRARSSSRDCRHLLPQRCDDDCPGSTRLVTFIAVPGLRPTTDTGTPSKSAAELFASSTTWTTGVLHYAPLLASGDRRFMEPIGSGAP